MYVPRMVQGKTHQGRGISTLTSKRCLTAEYPPVLPGDITPANGTPSDVCVPDGTGERRIRGEAWHEHLIEQAMPARRVPPLLPGDITPANGMPSNVCAPDGTGKRRITDAMHSWTAMMKLKPMWLRCSRKNYLSRRSK